MGRQTPPGGQYQANYSNATTGDLVQMVGEMAAQKFPASKRPEHREDTILQRVPVICNGNKGVFLVGRQVIVCLCNECEARAKSAGVPEMELSPTDFERHSGKLLANSHTSPLLKNLYLSWRSTSNLSIKPMDFPSQSFLQCRLRYKVDKLALYGISNVSTNVSRSCSTKSCQILHLNRSWCTPPSLSILCVSEVCVLVVMQYVE